MSFNAGDVVVPYAVFAERRERRNRIASILQEQNVIDVSAQSPAATQALEPAAEARIALERRPAAGEKGDGS